MAELSQCAIRPVLEADLEMVLSWRNRPEVRSVMLTQHEIKLAEHHSWFRTVSQDKESHLLIVETDGLPLGFVKFSSAVSGSIADWGFYLAMGAPPGSGSRLGRAALEHVFSIIGVHKVCGKVLNSNVSSLRLHSKLGFVQEGVLRQQWRIANNYHDLICFGLLKKEWQRLSG